MTEHSRYATQTTLSTALTRCDTPQGRVSARGDSRHVDEFQHERRFPPNRAKRPHGSQVAGDAMPRSPSSLHTASSPSSRGCPLVARNRTILPAATAAAAGADPDPVTPQEQTFGRAGPRGEISSSPASSPGRSPYRFQSPRARNGGASGGDAGILLSSPGSIYSSPDMTRSISAQSIFGPPLHQQQYQQHHPQAGIASSPLARSGSLDVVGPKRPKRAAVKRRRTVIGGPPTSPELSPRLSPPSFKRWYGREGENVWPPEVDEAFFRGSSLSSRPIL